ncbi:MAG: hypothetical protein PHF57_05300, partial [Methanoregula sp.]|nr:hypothetical protein [Methanoregula sp.]
MENHSLNQKIFLLKNILSHYTSTVVLKLYKNSADVSAKKRNIVSYPTHIINAVFTGATIFGYEHLRIESEESIFNLKLLVSILTLHDIGKYLENKYAISGGNSKANILKYFENDEFGITDFFPEIKGLLSDPAFSDEITWLIQNTELHDISQADTLHFRPRFGKLADYARLGDKVASITEDPLFLQKIFNSLRSGGARNYIHVVNIPECPQFFLHREVLKALLTFYKENGAIPFLLFNDGFFFIQENLSPLNTARIRDILLENISLQTGIGEDTEDEDTANSLNVRINNQSINDDSLLNFPISSDVKKRLLLKNIVENIPKAMKNVEIAIPPEKELQKKLATIIYSIYKNSDKDICDEKFKKKVLGYEVNGNKIEGIKDIQGPQKFKIFAAKELIEHNQDYDIGALFTKANQFLDEIYCSNNESTVFGNILSNLSLDFISEFNCEEIPKNKDELCFLCGSRTSNEYRAKKGYFLQARGYSKRGKILDEEKKICSICLIEKNLIENSFRNRKFSPAGDYLFAILYFDKIFANVSFFSDDVSKVELRPDVQVGGEKVQLKLGDFNGMYHIIPYRYNGKEESAKQTSRVKISRNILELISETGCKAVITSPYTLLRTYPEIFVNEVPLRLEISLAIDKIFDFEDDKNKLRFLNSVNSKDGKKGFFKVEKYDLLSYLHFIKLKAKEKTVWGLEDETKDVCKKSFGDDLMKIEDLAQQGKALYGNVWGSSYKRTVFMRTALDNILVGKQQGLTDEELVT